jgi:hypothetical protein
VEGPLANDQALGVGITASAALVLLAVLMMRYNVAIGGQVGGQEISKTGKGLLAYQPTILGREGILAAATVLVLPLILLSMLVRFLPPWQQAAHPSVA